MPWNDTARREHRRDSQRYPSDLTAREWALIAPMLPAAKRGGRPRTTDLRAVTDAILYIASSGCQWRMLPKDFPPVSTVQGYFYAWRDSGLWQGINHLLVMSARELEGREASPSAGVIDSQSVKTTESGGVSGFDAGKKIKGRKRHIMTDTLGLLLFAVIHSLGLVRLPAILRALLPVPKPYISEDYFSGAGKMDRGVYLGIHVDEPIQNEPLRQCRPTVSSNDARELLQHSINSCCSTANQG
jgi:putative transposase